jgi:hypothetical protein
MRCACPPPSNSLRLTRALPPRPAWPSPETKRSVTRYAYPLRSSRPSTPALEPAVTGRTPAMNYSFAEPLDLADKHEVIRG